MSELKHTPGPWRTSGFENGSYSVEADSPSEPGKVRIIAALCTKEDAHLIATAPKMAAERDRLIQLNAELLRVLIECHDAMAYMSEYDIPLTLPDMVSNAIAHATGSAS